MSGSWRGTATEQGNTEEFFCPGLPRDVTIQIFQQGSAVTFSVPGGYCTHGQTLNFQGTLAGTRLTGQWDMSTFACDLQGGAGGTAEPSHILVGGDLAGSCNNVGVSVDVSR